MKTVVVSDTNIFIDLVKLNLLGDLFALPWDVRTTDFVISELTDSEQKAAEIVRNGDMYRATQEERKIAREEYRRELKARKERELSLLEEVKTFCQ